MKNLLLFSCVEWDDLKQRPQFLAEQLADLGCNVSYLVVGSKKTRLGERKNGVSLYELSFLRGYMRLSGLRKIIKKIIGLLLNEQSFDVLILTNPIQLELIPAKLLEKPVLYDCMDLLPEFYEGKKKELLKKLEGKLCERASFITATSDPLKTYLEANYNVREKCALLTNAFDYNDCLQAREIEGIEHPALVYMGAIDWWVDFAFLSEAMDRLPDAHLYIVGSGDREQVACLAKRKNCHLLGGKPHVEALSILKSADIALMPFKPCKLVEMVDPVKLYEYIALGKPVVSSYWPALSHYKDNPMLMFYHDIETFLEAVAYAQEKGTHDPDARFIDNNTWATRANSMYKVIEAISPGRNRENPADQQKAYER